MSVIVGKFAFRFLFFPLFILLATSFCLPAFSNYLKEEETTDEINKFVKSVRFSKNAAREHGAELKLCASANGKQCSFSSDWSKGWILIDAKSLTVLKRWFLSTGRLGFMGEKASMKFGKNGFIIGSATALAMFDRGCRIDSDGEGRRVTISVTGKSDVERIGCGYPVQPLFVH